MPVWLQHGAILAAVGTLFAYVASHLRRHSAKLQRIEVAVNGRVRKALQTAERADRRVAKLERALAAERAARRRERR